MIVGVDTGGTFTDGVIYDPVGGDVRIAKIVSTPADPSSAFIGTVTALGSPLADVDAVVHGTTIATNAVLQRRGAVCGLIATRGFRDLLDLRRRDRPSLYGLGGTYEPLVPRHLRTEVGERTTHDGTILEEIDPEEVREAARRLRELGAEVLVISFLHAYANPANERSARSAAADVWPVEKIVVAHEIMPQFREFERTSTAVVNGYVQPLLTSYLGASHDRLGGDSYAGEFTVIQSNGGAISHRLAGRFGANLVMSGPAAGVTAACAIAGAVGIGDVVTFDMGGTSTDICLVKSAKPATTSIKNLDFGIPLGITMLDIETLGAGGGSIAFVDRSGILEVGPLSAGSVPGPACYGRGGTAPTVTDANVVLGRISADRDLGGRGELRLDAAAAEQAVGLVARDLGIDVVGAAEAIIAVANSKMAASMRLVSVDRGQDPREFSLLAFGGAGPLHASALMRDAGFQRTLVPLFPGITSAFGCILSDIRADTITSVHRLLEDVVAADLAHLREEQRATTLDLLQQQGHGDGEVVEELEADLCYLWQTTAISVPVSPSDLSGERLLERFEAVYAQLYGGVLRSTPVELVALRTTARAVRSPVDLKQLAQRVLVDAAEPLGEKLVYFAGEQVPTPVYHRLGLRPGFASVGPAILEQEDSTTLVSPGDAFSVDAVGTIVLEASA